VRKVGSAPVRRLRHARHPVTSASFLSAGMIVRVLEGGRRVAVKIVSLGSDEPRIVVERGDGSRLAVTVAEIAEIVVT
jgi:hypothetical protein